MNKDRIVGGAPRQGAFRRGFGRDFPGVGAKYVDSTVLVPLGAIMSLSHDRADFASNYDECTVLLLSAFFCVTGQTSQDKHLRKAIENLLVDLTNAQDTTAPPNIVPFRRQWQPFPRRDRWRADDRETL